MTSDAPANTLILDPARLAMSHYCAGAARLSEVAGLCSSAGLGGVAVTETPAPDDTSPSAARTLLAEKGLHCSSVNSAGYFSRAKDNAYLITLAGELGAPLNVIDGGIAPGRPLEPLDVRRALLLDGLRRLTALARDEGVAPSLEAIHPRGIVGKGTVNTVAELGRVLTGIDGLACTLDLYHSWWDPDLPHFVKDFADRIAVVQVCGLTVAPSGDVERSPNPTDGHPVLTDFIHLLETSGYRGLYEIEYFRHDDIIAAEQCLLQWTKG